MKIPARRSGPDAGDRAAPKSFFRRHGRGFFILLLAVLLVIGAALLLRLMDKRLHPAAAETSDGVTATLAAVGDITVDDTLLAEALKSDGTYDFTTPFLNVAGLLSGADLTVGNLECTFSGAPYGGSACSAPEALAGTLNTLGFDLLQTANSKSLAGGLSGLSDTIGVVRSYHMEPLGTYASQAARDASGGVTVQEVNGIRIAFVAFTKGFDGMSIPSGSEYCANLLYTDYDTLYSAVAKTSIVNMMNAAKAQSPDVIVALVHWGSEFKMTVSSSQNEIADLLFQNGADVILGSHSHMVGPMEERQVARADGTEKTVFLAYSLGNFFSTADRDYARESAVLNLTFRKSSATGKTELASVDYVPVYLADSTENRSGRFQILDAYQAISLYEASYLDRVTDSVYDKLRSTITDLAAHTNSDFDRGP